MAGYVLHLSEQENITLSAAVTRRLIDGGDGDAALLYLCLLKNRGSASPETLRAELKWDEARRSRAEAALARMGLVSAPKPEEPTPSPVPAPSAERPAYSREDVARKLEQDASFSALLREVERKLGPLSTPSVGKLLGLYEDLGLPADVLFLLVNHCIARHAAQYGAGRLPTMRRIEQEGYIWARKGLLSLTSANDYHPKELERVRKMGVQPAREFPCVQVINLAYESSSKDSLGAPVTLQVRPEWQDIEPIAYLPGLEKLPIGYFVTPIVNTVDPSSELGAAMFAPAIPQIIDADVQFSRLDWEYEGGELGVDIDDQYLKPLGENGQALTDSEALRRFGVPAKALDKTMPEHTQRLFRGLNIDTGIADGGTFYQVFAPSLRDGNYLSGLNQYLRHVEQKVGLSYGVLSQVSELEKTATEIMSSKQKLYATVSDLQAALEDALRGLIDALDFWADQVDSAPPASAELQISFHWDDSIIVDRLTEMSQWQAELQLGLRSKAEYRQHFYGEDEETAAAAVAAIQQEAVAQDVLQGVLTQQAAPQSTTNAPAVKQTTGKPNGSQRGRQGPLKKGRP